jgi:hypothetical protein
LVEVPLGVYGFYTVTKLSAVSLCAFFITPADGSTLLLQSTLHNNMVGEVVHTYNSASSFHVTSVFHLLF